MKNNKSAKNKSSISTLKNFYCVTLENAGKRTQGKQGSKSENTTTPAKYTDQTA